MNLYYYILPEYFRKNVISLQSGEFEANFKIIEFLLIYCSVLFRILLKKRLNQNLVYSGEISLLGVNTMQGLF